MSTTLMGSISAVLRTEYFNLDYLCLDNLEVSANFIPLQGNSLETSVDLTKIIYDIVRSYNSTVCVYR